MKINLSKIGEGILDCLRKFPSEASLGLYFLVIYILQSQMSYDDTWRKELQDVLPLLPAFYVFTYSLNRLCRGKMRFLYWLSPYLFVPILLWVNLDHFVDSIGFGFTLVLSLFVLLACRRKWNNREFADNSIQTFVDMAIAFFVGHVLALAILAIYASIVYIFDFEWGKLMEYFYITILFIFIPLTFCQMQEKKTEYILPRFVDIIINYILSPGVVIYTGILYLYIIVIAVNWELPKGGIGYMVLAFIAVSMAGRMAQLVVSKHPFAWFYDRFSWIALPPLALFWIGCLERIVTYSLTESRVYLLASGALTTMYVFLLFSKRFGTYQMMALISAVCIALLTFVPGISAKSIGIHSQTHRLKHYIAKLDMLNDSTQKLKAETIFIDEVDPVSRDYRELKECYAYLRQQLGGDYMTATYGPCSVMFSNSSVHDLYLKITKDIDIRPYSKYIRFEGDNSLYRSTFEDGIVTVRRSDDSLVVVRYDIHAYLKEHPEQMITLSESGETYLQEEPLVYYNDSCMLLMEELTYRLNDKDTLCTRARVHALFIK